MLCFHEVLHPFSVHHSNRVPSAGSSESQQVLSGTVTSDSCKCIGFVLSMDVFVFMKEENRKLGRSN